MTGNLFFIKSSANRVFRLLLIFFFFFTFLPIFSEEPVKIRVGIFDFETYYGVNSSGDHYGYGYSYLNKIKKNIPVVFEYVHGTWTECLTMLKKGEIDLLDTVQYTRERAENFTFSKYSTGTSYGKLFTRFDNDSLTYNDFDAFDGITIGLLRDNSRNAGFLEFALKSDFTFKSVEYDSTSVLKEALYAGEVDAIVTSSLFESENEKALARFDPSPFYLLTPKNKPHITRLIDEALELIQIDTPLFEYDLYKQFYSREMDNLVLTKYEKNYIKNHAPLKIVYDSYWPPFESYDREKKGPVGINVDILQLVTQKTGLQFTLLDGYTYDQAITMISEKKTDMLLSYDTNPKKAEELDIVLSDSFLSTPICIVGSGTVIGENSVFAIPKIYPLHYQFIQKHFKNNKVHLFNDIIDCYEAIEKGRADFTMENIYAVTNTMRSGKYQRLTIASVTSLQDRFSFAFRGDIDPVLIDIFNKGISAVSNANMEKLMIEFSTRQGSTISFQQFFFKYRIQIQFLSVFVLLFIICALIFIIKMQVKNKKALWTLAYIDSLTGLGNLLKFKQELKKALQENSSKSYVIAMVDVEHFNLVNEMYGFSSGDRVLKTIAQSLLESAKKSGGTAARVGSDDFVFFIESDKNEEVFGKNNDFCEFKEFVLQKTACSLEFSMGRYFIEPDENDVDQIFEKVNYAHNFAKKNRNSGEIFNYNNEMKKIAIVDREMETRMYGAIEQGEFKVFLQPKFRLSDEKLVGAEALVRWVQDDHTVISPARFIPLFEKNGFITRLDFFMFEATCRLIAGWIKDGILPVPVSVNFSRLHLRNTDFVRELIRIAALYEVPNSFLEIELTESTMLDTEDVLEDVLVNLHDAGFSLSMDDFGTGYSSLGLLKNLPVDIIKIDRSFFNDAQNNRRAKIVIANVISMAKELKILTVAEGVELHEHILFLRETGCDIVQGFYYAKPMPSDDFTAKIKNFE